MRQPIKSLIYFAAFVSSLAALSACKYSGPDMPEQVEDVQVENNYGYENPEELESLMLRAAFAIEDHPYIAIVKDIEIKFPEMPSGNSVDTDGFVSGVRQYKVDLIRALRGDLPRQFQYQIYGEAANFGIRDRPYPLAFCYRKDVDAFVAKEIEGQMLDDPEFVDLFLDVWEQSEPLSFDEVKDLPC